MRPQGQALRVRNKQGTAAQGPSQDRHDPRIRSTDGDIMLKLTLPINRACRIGGQSSWTHFKDDASPNSVQWHDILMSSGFPCQLPVD